MSNEQHQERVLYLLHFEQPVRNCRHYLGITWKTHLMRRLRQHEGHHGANLTSKVSQLGVRFHLVCVWEGATFKQERDIKRASHFSKLCYMCSPSRQRDHRWPAFVSEPKPYRELEWTPVEWRGAHHHTHSLAKKKDRLAS